MIMFLAWNWTPDVTRNLQFVFRMYNLWWFHGLLFAREFGYIVSLLLFQPQGHKQGKYSIRTWLNHVVKGYTWPNHISGARNVKTCFFSKIYVKNYTWPNHSWYTWLHQRSHKVDIPHHLQYLVMPFSSPQVSNYVRQMTHKRATPRGKQGA